MPESAPQVLRRLVPYFAPYQARACDLIGVLLVAGTLADLAGPYLIGVAVDQFIDPVGPRRRAGWLACWPADGDRIAGSRS